MSLKFKTSDKAPQYKQVLLLEKKNTNKRKKNSKN